MATLPISSNTDHENNQICNVRLQMLSSAPSALEAKIYYDTTLHKFGYHNGTKWVYDTELTFTNIVAGLGYTPANNAIEINGYPISSDVTLTASDVGAVPTNRTVNGKVLSSDITLNASDVGALIDSTTINDLTTTAQQNALNSGATTTNISQIGTNTTNISTIQDKIPSSASSSNQLADKQYVDDQISTNSASFDGSWATYAAIPTTVAGFTNDGLPTPTNNNYLVVLADETQDGGTWRYKYVDDGTAYNKNKWQVEYEVNESPFTQTQLDAINSGANNTNIAQIGTNTLSINTINSQISTINSALSEKTGKLTATNPALTQSGGVCTWSVPNTLATANIMVFVYRVSDGVQVFTEVDVSNSTVVIKFNSTSNISSGAYRMVAIG